MGIDNYKMKKRHNVYKRSVALTSKLRKCTGMLIPNGDIEFLHVDPLTGDEIYRFRSPLTHEWSEYRISARQKAANVVPMEISVFLDYYAQCTRVLEIARVTRPMNVDLTPLDAEEMQIFGVKHTRAPISKTPWPLREYF